MFWLMYYNEFEDGVQSATRYIFLSVVKRNRKFPLKNKKIKVIIIIIIIITIIK